MTSPTYTTANTVFKQMLGGLSKVLAIAEADAAARKIEPNALLRQVQVACDFAKSVSARLAGAEVPASDDSEQGFADLRARIAKTLAFIDGLAPARFEGCETREIVTQAGTPKEKRFSGQSYLLNYGLPHFFFHVTTAYAILRHNGVEVGKKDYVGSY